MESHNEDIIESTTVSDWHRALPDCNVRCYTACVQPIEGIIGALAKRGCLDLTSSIDSAASSDRPCAGGGFCDVYRGKLKNGTRIAIKSLRVYESSPLDEGDSEGHKVLKVRLQWLAWCAQTHTLGCGVERRQRDISLVETESP